MAQFDNPMSQRAQTRFIRQSMDAPLLTREHEFELARAWRNHKDEEALHELIASYMRLAVSLASRYRNYGLPMSDLVQEGAVGIMQAAERFDPDRDVRFSTYATWWIRSAMQDYILRNWSIVRTGTTAAQKSLFFNLRRLRSRIEEATRRPLDHEGREQIAEALSVNLSEVEAMESRLIGSDHSLNTPVGVEGDEEWQTFLPDEGPSPEDLVIGYHDGQVRNEWLQDAMTELTEREQTIIRTRRLTEEGATLEELGRVLGVSKERVRQLEHRALGKLRNSMLERGAEPADLILGD